MSPTPSQCHDIASLLQKMKHPTAIQLFSNEFADRMIIYGEFENTKHTFKSYMWHPEMECFIEQTITRVVTDSPQLETVSQP